MRTEILALAAAGLVAAHPHQHGHAHIHQRQAASPVVSVVTVPGPTVVACVLDGAVISDNECQQGIANDTLKWANGAPASATWGSAANKAQAVAPSSSSSSSSSSSTSTTTTAAPAAATTAAAASSGGAWYDAVGVDTPFPDGTIDCTDFPSAYGALNIDWMNLGGWIGIQSPGVTTGSGYDDITTVSNCAGNNCCGEGDFCSYACPAGYQKSQWPSLQGATAQSVGGLLCQGGKLHLTNPSMSSNLCMPGTSAVSVQVQNNLGQEVSVCRTDYPGTESETVPLQVDAGATQPLTCPDTDNYYMWQGKGTSAQYYVNPAGVGVQDACQWGSGGDTGNWAPLNIGVGYSNGMAYVSMLPNTPTTTATLAYKVTLSGGDLGQSCTYENGMYYSSVLPGGSSSTGCTISANSGTITYTFS